MINFGELRKKLINRRRKLNAETLKAQYILSKETVLSNEEIARKKIEEALASTKHPVSKENKEEAKESRVKSKQNMLSEKVPETNIWKSYEEKISIVDSVFTKALQSMQSSVPPRNRNVECKNETETRKQFECNACLQLGRDHSDEDCPVLQADVQCVRRFQSGHSYPDTKCSVFKEHIHRLTAVSCINPERTTEGDPKQLWNLETPELTKELIRCTECLDEGHTKDDPVCIYFSKPTSSPTTVLMDFPPLVKTSEFCNSGNINDERIEVCCDCSLAGHFSNDNPRCLYYEKPSNASTFRSGFAPFPGICQTDFPPQDDAEKCEDKFDEIAQRVIDERKVNTNC